VVVVEPGPFTTALFASSPQPSDTEARAATYPEVSPQTFAAMGGAFDELFADPETPTDPSLVVDRMLELAGMAPGERPFRSVVGIDFGVRDLNAADAPYAAGVIEAMGLAEFTTLAPPSRD